MKTKWRNAILMAVVILLLDLGALLLGTTRVFHITWSVGSVGIITFIGILMLVNYLSESPGFEKGEMRKAIAGSFIAVYFIIGSIAWIQGILLFRYRTCQNNHWTFHIPDWDHCCVLLWVQRSERLFIRKDAFGKG